MASTQDILYMAATIWGEARGEPYLGKVAVAWVIMNRANKPGAWSRQSDQAVPADTPAAVCIEPLQFSCWNAADPNSKMVKALTAGDALQNLGNEVYRSCLRAAIDVIDLVEADPTNGSTNYHATGILPAWAVRKSPAAEIGRHLFYNNVT